MMLFLRSILIHTGVQCNNNYKDDIHKRIKFVSFTGAAAASRVFNEALAKIAVNAQHGGTTDIGKFIFCYDTILRF